MIPTTSYKNPTTKSTDHSWNENTKTLDLLHVIGKHNQYFQMGVSKNRGTPKWMVKIMENPIKIDDLGVPLFLETPIYFPNGVFFMVMNPMEESKVKHHHKQTKETKRPHTRSQEPSHLSFFPIYVSKRMVNGCRCRARWN